MFQSTIADLVTDEAVARAHRAADGAWLERAAATVRQVARARTTFTTDDIWAAGLPEPRESRALGPVLRQAQAAGAIIPTGEYARSERPACHRRPVRVWRSLIAGGGA